MTGNTQSTLNLSMETMKRTNPLKIYRTSHIIARETRVELSQSVPREQDGGIFMNRSTRCFLYILVGLVFWISLTGCPLINPINTMQQVTARPEEKVFLLYTNLPLTVSIDENEAVVYRFDAKVTQEGLYQFETLGNNDTLCALVHQKEKQERFLVVRDIGGSGENCRIIWAFPPGIYHFKVRVDGRKKFQVVLRSVRNGKLVTHKLPRNKPHVDVINNLGDQHQFHFSLKAPRLVQFKVRGKGLMQCVLQTSRGKWLSSPLYRQPYGTCTMGQWLETGNYTFTIRSDKPSVKYQLLFRQIRMQQLPVNQVREGYLQPKLFDIFKLHLGKEHRHIIQTHGRLMLSCTLEDILGHVVVQHRSNDGKNCHMSGQFPPGIYYLRVRLKRGIGGVYQVSLRQQNYTTLPTTAHRTIFPDFQQPMQLYRIKVRQARLYQIEAKGRKMRCVLSNINHKNLTVMNLSEPTRCLLFANLYEGHYFLRIYPLSREDKPYQLSIVEYKPPLSNQLQDKQPRLIGPVYPGFNKPFTLKITKPQLLVLETRGRIDTLCQLYDANNRRIARNDDGGRRYNCRINRYLRPGTYRLQVKVTGRRSGIFWVQRRAKKLPWIRLNRQLTCQFKYRKQHLTYMLRVRKPGMFAIRTRSHLDTMCSILNQDWKQIAKDDDSGTKKNCFLAQFLTPGIYPIQVWLYRKNQGKIRLKVSKLPLLQLKIGQYSRGRLRPPRWTDFYRIQVTQPGLYVVRTFGNTDTKCILRNEQSKIITKNDDRGGGDKNCQIVDNLMPGVYFFQVHLYKNRNRKTGTDYKLLYDRHKTPVTKLPLNQYKPARLAPRQITRFQFTIQRAARYRIETQGLLDPKCTLFSHIFRKLAEDDDKGSGRNCRIIRHLSPGIYELQVRPATSNRSRSKGTYRLGVFKN